MEILKFLTNKVIISECENTADDIIATFVLCDFSTNLNNVRLNRATIEDWMASMVNKPLVGKIVTNNLTGAQDFTGHNVKIKTVRNTDGTTDNIVSFDTYAYGSFSDVFIKEIDGVESLCAVAHIWRRYPSVCELICKRAVEGELNTSWEISVAESHYDTNGVKVIDNGVFTAHCLLGRNVTPAYSASKLLEVAEDIYADGEFNAAVLNDMQRMEVSTMPNESKSVDMEEVSAIKDEDKPVEEQEDKDKVEEEVVEQPADEDEDEDEDEDKDKVEEEAQAETSAVQETSENAGDEQASLTEGDIVESIMRKVRETYPDYYVMHIFPIEGILWLHDWRGNELDFVRVSYTVKKDGTIVIGDKLEPFTLVASTEEIASKNEALIAANARIDELMVQIAELQPYKEQAEKAEYEAKRDELIKFAISSKQITQAEIEDNNNIIASYINDLNTSAIKEIIADRIVAVMSAEAERVQVAESTNIITPAHYVEKATIESIEYSPKDIVGMYIRKH